MPSGTKQRTRTVKDKAKEVVNRDQSRGQDQRRQIALGLSWLTFSRVQSERQSLRKRGEKEMRLKLVYIKRQSLYKFKVQQIMQKCEITKREICLARCISTLSSLHSTISRLQMSCRTKVMTRLKFSWLAPETLGRELAPPHSAAAEVGSGGGRPPE